MIIWNGLEAKPLIIDRSCLKWMQIFYLSFKWTMRVYLSLGIQVSEEEPIKTDKPTRVDLAGDKGDRLKEVPKPVEKKDQATLDQEDIERSFLGGYTSKEHNKYASAKVDHPFSLDERQRLDNDN